MARGCEPAYLIPARSLNDLSGTIPVFSSKVLITTMEKIGCQRDKHEKAGVSRISLFDGENSNIQGGPMEFSNVSQGNVVARAFRHSVSST